jgi:glycosyltransferase involved in cell wall biosynthesis
VLDSRYLDFELLLVADGPPIAVAQEFFDSISDKRVRLLSSSGAGLVDALNTGILESSSEFIARMDGDDLSHTDRLELQVKYLMLNPSVSVVGTNIGFICEHGQPLGSSKFKRKVGKWMLSQPLTAPVAHPSVMIRRAALESAGRYRSLFAGFQAEDLDLWNRVLRTGQIHNLPEVLLKYRVHKNQVSTTRSSSVALSSIAASLWNIHESHSSLMPIELPWSNDPEEVIRLLISEQKLKKIGFVGRWRVRYVLSYNGALLAVNKLRLTLAPRGAREISSITARFSDFNLGSLLILPLIFAHHARGIFTRRAQGSNICEDCARFSDPILGLSSEN